MRALILVGFLGAVMGCGDDDRTGNAQSCDDEIASGLIVVDSYCQDFGFPLGCRLSCDPDVEVPPMCTPAPMCGDAGIATCVCP